MCWWLQQTDVEKDPVCSGHPAAGIAESGVVFSLVLFWYADCMIIYVSIIVFVCVCVGG